MQFLAKVLYRFRTQCLTQLTKRAAHFSCPVYSSKCCLNGLQRKPSHNRNFASLACRRQQYVWSYKKGKLMLIPRNFGRVTEGSTATGGEDSHFGYTFGNPHNVDKVKKKKNYDLMNLAENEHFLSMSEIIGDLGPNGLMSEKVYSTAVQEAAKRRKAIEKALMEKYEYEEENAQFEGNQHESSPSEFETPAFTPDTHVQRHAKAQKVSYLAPEHQAPSMEADTASQYNSYMKSAEELAPVSAPEQENRFEQLTEETATDNIVQASLDESEEMINAANYGQKTRTNENIVQASQTESEEMTNAANYGQETSTNENIVQASQTESEEMTNAANYGHETRTNENIVQALNPKIESKELVQETSNVSRPLADNYSYTSRLADTQISDNRQQSEATNETTKASQILESKTSLPKDLEELSTFEKAYKLLALKKMSKTEMGKEVANTAKSLQTGIKQKINKVLSSRNKGNKENTLKMVAANDPTSPDYDETTHLSTFEHSTENRSMDNFKMSQQAEQKSETMTIPFEQEQEDEKRENIIDNKQPLKTISVEKETMEEIQQMEKMEMETANEAEVVKMEGAADQSLEARNLETFEVKAAQDSENIEMQSAQEPNEADIVKMEAAADQSLEARNLDTFEVKAAPELETVEMQSAQEAEIAEMQSAQDIELPRTEDMDTGEMQTMQDATMTHMQTAQTALEEMETQSANEAKSLDAQTEKQENVSENNEEDIEGQSFARAEEAGSDSDEEVKLQTSNMYASDSEGSTNEPSEELTNRNQISKGQKQVQSSAGDFQRLTGTGALMPEAESSDQELKMAIRTAPRCPKTRKIYAAALKEAAKRRQLLTAAKMDQRNKRSMSSDKKGKPKKPGNACDKPKKQDDCKPKKKKCNLWDPCNPPCPKQECPKHK